MIIENVSTLREFEHWPSWDLVYEWEDVLVKRLQAKLVCRKKWQSGKLRWIPLINLLCRFRGNTFCYEMSPKLRKRSANANNVVPCIVDFYLTEEQMPLFIRSYKHNPVVCISSKECFDFINDYISKNGIKDFRIEHLPLSISDKYAVSPNSCFEKKYDLVIMGRQNPVLQSYLNEYMKKHPNMVYVNRKVVGNKFLYYTNTGQEVGDINTREKYISLMRSARIGLYATPGVDSDERNTKAYHQVTPRFLELVASGCHIIARYKSNSDTIFYEMEKFLPSVNSYKQFEELMDLYRKTDVDMARYSEYLAKHYTSARANRLAEILNKI